MGNPDNGHTSRRLRLATLKAMNEIQRPIAAHEVEEWIGQNDPDLSKELSTKCYDYVRIILSLTSRDMIVRYKCDIVFPGVDRRAAFYGLPNHQYDPAIWKLVGRKNEKKRWTRRDTVKAVPVDHVREQDPPYRRSVQSLFAPQDLKPTIHIVDDQKCDDAWFALTTFIPPNDEFWHTLMEAMQEMRAGVQEGKDPDEVLAQILSGKPGLIKPVVLSDVLDILSKEAYVDQDGSLFHGMETLLF
jgi:hypothetical protein